MKNEELLEYLEKSICPMTVVSLASEFNSSKYTIERALDELITGGKVVKITPHNPNSNRTYYTSSKKMAEMKVKEDEKREDNNSNVTKEIDQVIVNAKDNYDDLTEKIEQIDKNVNSIYVNIISMMAIFVAIFALITVNANIVFSLTEENASAVFEGIVTINIVVVICIIALLSGVRFIIINPLLGKKDGTK